MSGIQPITDDLHALLSDKGDLLNIEFPNGYDDYTCPISGFMMFKPMSVQPCGHNFESIEIEKWRKCKEEKEEDYCCPLCRRKITMVIENKPLKEEIHQFLSTTREKLKLEKKGGSSADDKEDESKDTVIQEANNLIDNFLKYGNDEVMLQTKFAKFCSILAEAVEASKEASEESSRSCRIL